MCQNRHHINSATPCKLWVTASHTRTSKSSVSIAATVIRLPILWVSVVVVVLPMSMKTKRLKRRQLFLIPLCAFSLTHSSTCVTPGLALCSLGSNAHHLSLYVIIFSFFPSLSLSLSNMERNPLVELICFNECLLPC